MASKLDTTTNVATIALCVVGLVLLFIRLQEYRTAPVRQSPPTPYKTGEVVASQRPACEFLHMCDARALREHFSEDRGWSEGKVDSLIKQLLNNCFGPYGWVAIEEDALVGAACTVDLDDYRRAQRELPRLRSKEPEAFCVDYVTQVALQMLPEDPTGLHGKRGSVELVFDRNERFKHMIFRAWNRRETKRRGVLRRVHNIREDDARTCPGLQAADLLAWHTSRDLANKGSRRETFEQR